MGEMPVEGGKAPAKNQYQKHLAGALMMCPRIF